MGLILVCFFPVNILKWDWYLIRDYTTMKLLLNIVIIIGIIAQKFLTKSSLFHCFFFSIFQYVKSR